MGRLEFDPETHIYTVDGKNVPSVTEIIAPLHRSYGDINKAVLDMAAARGTAVHEACEAIDLGEEPELYYEIEGYVCAYMDWLNIYEPVWTAIEKQVFCEDLWYAGTLDRMGYLNDGKLAIVDIKTSQPTREAYISVCLQTLAYAYAATENHTEVIRYGLFLMKDGKYRLLDCKEWEEKNGADAETAFAMLLATHKMITKLLEKKGMANESTDGI